MDYALTDLFTADEIAARTAQKAAEARTKATEELDEARLVLAEKEAAHAALFPVEQPSTPPEETPAPTEEPQG